MGFTYDLTGDDNNYDTKNVRISAYDKKLPTMYELDFRVSKEVSLGDKSTLNPDMDVFNLFNKNTPLHVEEALDSGVASRVGDLMYPRTCRLGLRYSF